MSTYSIYFSPTQGTKKITNTLAQEISGYREIDLCVCSEEIKDTAFSENDTCFIGVPSYGGRVPNVAVERIRHFKGNNAKAVLVVVYGNRDYDDTLLELYDIANGQGFDCISGVTAISQHSIMRQYAAGRPDTEDINQLKAFAAEIQSKIHTPVKTNLKLKGNRPYKEYNGVPFKPVTSKLCSKCGLCARLCPVRAIPSEKPNETCVNQCISCMRCIQICPYNARHLDETMLNAVSEKMEALFRERKQNELFL